MDIDYKFFAFSDCLFCCGEYYVRSAKLYRHPLSHWWAHFFATRCFTADQYKKEFLLNTFLD